MRISVFRIRHLLRVAEKKKIEEKISKEKIKWIKITRRTIQIKSSIYFHCVFAAHWSGYVFLSTSNARTLSFRLTKTVRASGLFYSQRRTTEMSFFLWLGNYTRKTSAVWHLGVDSFVCVCALPRHPTMWIQPFLSWEKNLRWSLLLDVIYWHFTDEKPRDIISHFRLSFSIFPEEYFNELNECDWCVIVCVHAEE